MLILQSKIKSLIIVKMLQYEVITMTNSYMPLSEKLRPKSIDDLNMRPNVSSMIEQMIQNGSISNLLFYGKPGTGKTTAARLIAQKIDADCYELNGSFNDGDKTLVKNIENFGTSLSMFGKPKICFIDEADYLSNNVQASLRKIIEYVSSNCRFIFTANDINRLSDAIQSRFICINFDQMLFDHASIISQMINKYETMLPLCGYKFDREIVSKCVRLYYPDFRAVANRFEIELERI